jgi:site-specific recombinase XerD
VEKEANMAVNMEEMITRAVRKAMIEQDEVGISPIVIPPLSNGETKIEKKGYIRTQDLIDSLLRLKEHKGLKESTLKTYRKCFARFEARFPFMPDELDDILSYLGHCNGETRRYKLNEQANLKMLYEHAMRFFGMVQNPLEWLERPEVIKKPIRTLSMEQGRLLDSTPGTLKERVVLDLMFGHGWRGVEVRRVLAGDVAGLHESLIWCRGKERNEWAPILPETEERLRELADGLAPDEHVILADRIYRGRRQPLGEDGLEQLLERLWARAGIGNLTGHDLRRSFATLVVEAGCDYFLAMRLLRDKIPGQGERYIKYPLSRLVEDLRLYSPLCVIAQKETASGAAPEAVYLTGGDG